MLKKDKIILEVLICTIDDGIDKVIKNILSQLKDVLITISHQITEDKYIYNGILPQNTQYLVLQSTGLSKNRNNSLKNARGDICLIADDDLEYVDDFKEIIVDTYKKNNDPAVVTFQSKGLKRWNRTFLHNWRTVGQVTSWMITFNPKKVREYGVKFDERFGLGARYPQGEENIFLSDLLKLGAKVVCSSEVIVKHADVSSGYIFSPKHITSKIVVARRMFGWLGGLATLFVFSITKYKYYKRNKISILNFFKYGIKGLKARF